MFFSHGIKPSSTTVRANAPCADNGRVRPHGQPGPASAPIRCPDILALVAFDHEARLVAPFSGAFDARFAAAVQNLPQQVRGSVTDIAAGLVMANDLLAEQPRGLLRRIWLLSDGYPNPADQPIDAQIRRAADQHTNINCVGIGMPGGYDRPLLERIAESTRNGRFCEAQTAADLGRAFSGLAQPPRPGAHRSEATVFVVDVSGSMLESMGAARRIDAVAAAMFGLLRYKQARWF